MKFVEARALADPEVAARKIVEVANAVEPYFDNRILIEKINGPFLYEHGWPQGRSASVTLLRQCLA